MRIRSFQCLPPWGKVSTKLTDEGQPFAERRHPSPDRTRTDGRLRILPLISRYATASPKGEAYFFVFPRQKRLFHTLSAIRGGDFPSLYFCLPEITIEREIPRGFMVEKFVVVQAPSLRELSPKVTEGVPPRVKTPSVTTSSCHLPRGGRLYLYAQIVFFFAVVVWGGAPFLFSFPFLSYFARFCIQWGQTRRARISEGGDCFGQSNRTRGRGADRADTGTLRSFCTVGANV